MGLRFICLWVTIVRHAETELSRVHPRVLQGQKDYPLNNTGENQAEALAWRLAKESFDEIISSDLLRSKQTTEIIAKYHPEVPVTYDERLREKDLGDLAGMSWADAKTILREEGISLDDHVAKTGESPKQFEDRIVGFYSEIIERFLLHPNRLPYSKSEETLGSLAKANSDVQLATPVGSEPPRTPGRKFSVLPEENLMKFGKNAGLVSPGADSVISLTSAPKQKQPRLKQNHVLLVTHGGPIQELMKHLINELGFVVQGPPPHGFPKNSGVSRFVISRINKPDGIDYDWEGRIALYNCLTHLASMNKIARERRSNPNSGTSSSASTPNDSPSLRHQNATRMVPTPSHLSPQPAVRSDPSLGGPGNANASSPSFSQHERTDPKFPSMKRAIFAAGNKLQGQFNFSFSAKKDGDQSPTSPSTATGVVIIGNAPLPQPNSNKNRGGKSLGW